MGITGNDSVTQLGAMLQVQMKTAGSSDEAANNLKNWMEKIGSGEVVKAYKDAGIDYQASMNTGLQNKMSTLESSFALAQKYVEATDPKKAKLMAESMSKISQETDPAKAKEMMGSLEQALRTGDLFADMQVKAALTAYMQNKALYEQLKKDSAGASGILDKNLAERRETSAQKWNEAGQGSNDALRSIGDALQPITDRVATGILSVSRSLGELADKSPQVVSGVVAVGGAVAALAGLYSTAKVVRGAMNIGRGTLMGNPNIVQKVQVVNSLGLGGGSGGPVGGPGGSSEGGRGRGRRRWWGGRRKPEPVSASPSPGAAKPRVQVYSNGAAVPPKSGALSGWKPPTSAPAAGSARSLVPSTPAPRGPRVSSELRGSVPAEDARVECVVVEADWPEYERVWTMIEARVTGKVSAVDTPEVLAVVAETESAFPETMVIHRDAIDAVPVGTELIDRAHFTRLQAEISALRGLTPGLPPRPPEGQGLPRYGLRWNGPSQPLAVPMEDGYWTPWHLADQFRTKNTDGQEINP